MANWGTPTLLEGTASVDLLRKGRNPHQFWMLATFSKIKNTVWANMMQVQPNVCGVWLELLDHWFVTLMKSRQDLPSDSVHHLHHLPRWYQLFSAVTTSADALAQCGSNGGFGQLVSISPGIFSLEPILVVNRVLKSFRSFFFFF